MNMQFHDRRAISLGEMKPGQIGVEVSASNEGGGAKRRVFAAIHAPIVKPDGTWGDNKTLVIELTDLQNQYLDKLNGKSNYTRVTLLEKNQSIEFTPE